MAAYGHTATPADVDGARNRLLDAATQLFAMKGYEVTTVREIIAGAGTNLNAINYYFGGKQGLYRAVMTREIERARSFTTALPRAADDDPLDVRLESLVLRLLTFFVSSHTRLPRLAALELVNPSAAFGDAGTLVYESEREELRAIVLSALGEQTKKDLVDQCVRDVLAQCIYFMFMGESLQRAASPVFSSAAAVRKLAAHITAFSLGGFRALNTASTSPGINK